jgi:hypothetical protein
LSIPLRAATIERVISSKLKFFDNLIVPPIQE